MEANRTRSNRARRIEHLLQTVGTPPCPAAQPRVSDSAPRNVVARTSRFGFASGVLRPLEGYPYICSVNTVHPGTIRRIEAQDSTAIETSPVSKLNRARAMASWTKRAICQSSLRPVWALRAIRVLRRRSRRGVEELGAGVAKRDSHGKVLGAARPASTTASTA
jgi:hypothetical protein